MIAGPDRRPLLLYPRIICASVWQLSGVAAVCLCSSACRSTGRKSGAPSIVGTWRVRIPGAPFPYHVFVFHSDGTMEQSNPDAGDPNTSDSNGMGVWLPDDDRIKGKFVEIAGRRRHTAVRQPGAISFLINVKGDVFSGTASAVFFDAEGRQSERLWRQPWTAGVLFP